LEAEVLCTYFPEEYSANHLLYSGAEDCIFPSPEAQQRNPNVSDGVYWGLHQVALRIMGREASDKERAEQRMAWHVDQSDVKSNQLLTFLPMGGRNGKGGHVLDSDLMVFEHANGGKCFRLNTSIEDTVVFILMNSGQQMHGSAMDSLNIGHVSDSWSARFIAYGRNNVLHFTDGRKRGERHGLAFRQRKMRNHRPLSKETAVVGSKVSATFGKKKKKLLTATLILWDNQLHFRWDCDGTITKCKKTLFYSVECAETIQAHECRHCNPVPVHSSS
jgi:hypothetical protein